eukprot:13890372-Heterocapsa_arctica.AAC.1
MGCEAPGLIGGGWRGDEPEQHAWTGRKAEPDWSLKDANWTGGNVFPKAGETALLTCGPPGPCQ